MTLLFWYHSLRRHTARGTEAQCPFGSVKKHPPSESADRKNSYLTATASTASWMQQDALPYRVEAHLSHSATLCNPLQPSPHDDHPLHHLARLDYYCVRAGSPA